MTREKFLAALRAHQFETHGIEIEFQTMNGFMMPHPYRTEQYPNAVLQAHSRKLRDGLLEEVTAEVQRDLDGLHKLHPDIKKYGVWFYRLPGEAMLATDIIQYAKATAK